VPLPPLVPEGRGHTLPPWTHLLAGKGWGSESPNSDEGTETVVLFIFMYFVVYVDGTVVSWSGVYRVRGGGRAAEGAQAGDGEGREDEGTSRSLQPLHEPDPGGTHRSNSGLRSANLFYFTYSSFRIRGSLA
jgi:hypothetical protein